MHDYLKYRGRGFTTAGTSLPVLFDAFQAQPLRWYSLAYGEIYRGVSENLLLVGLDAGTLPVSGQQPYSGVGPLNAGLKGLPLVEEYALSKPVQATLGIEERDHRFCPAEWHLIRYALHLHDDCFASVEPVDDALLERLVHGTLRLHSHYLGQEVNWLSCLKELSLLLVEIGEFELRSDPKADVVYVDQPHQSYRRESSLPANPYHGKLVICDGKGSFQPGDAF